MIERYCFEFTFTITPPRARVQYEITQHPKLAAQLPAPQGELLQIALQSHRDALGLEQDNADVLFNSGQVLTSLAELISNLKHPGEEEQMQAGTYLQEAIELFQRCLMVQEMKYTEMQEEIELMKSGGVPPEPEAVPPAAGQSQVESGEEQEQWAMIVEPVTKNTLVDTAVAQLETLTTLCNLLTSNPGAGGVGWVQEYSSELVHSRLPAYAEGSDRQYEAALARAKFICALNDLLYRGGHTDIQTYQQEVGQVFGPELDVSADPEGLCGKADALTSLNQALSDIPPSEDDEAFENAVALRWKSLSTALDALTAATKLPDAENLPKIHLGRGDAEMHRWRLGRAPWNHTMAKQNGAMLLRNAQTYYRGATALARRDGAAEEERDGTCKEAIAAAIEGQNTKLEQLKSTDLQQVILVAQDMVEDGMVDGRELSALISS
jgi:tetratricopeptide (TPR) repeat protein